MFNCNLMLKLTRVVLILLGLIASPVKLVLHQGYLGKSEDFSAMGFDFVGGSMTLKFQDHLVDGHNLNDNTELWCVGMRRTEIKGAVIIGDMDNHLGGHDRYFMTYQGNYLYDQLPLDLASGNALTRLLAPGVFRTWGSICERAALFTGISPNVFSDCLKGEIAGGGVLAFGEIVAPNKVHTAQ